MSMLHALIHQSIVRYPDTRQKEELPRFVSKCTECLRANRRERTSVKPQQTSAQRLCLLSCLNIAWMLLDLSFDAESVFTPHLTRLLEQLCAIQALSRLAKRQLNNALMKVLIGRHTFNSCLPCIRTLIEPKIIFVLSDVKAKVTG